MGLFDELKGEDAAVLKPGGAGKVAIQRELETWRDLRALSGADYVYRSGGDWLLRHGEFYQGRELPEEYAHRAGEVGKCFINALTAAEEDPSLSYCEGIYSTGGFHFTNHAWCVAPDGGVVELTYPTRDLEDQLDSRGGPILPPEHWSYHGVVIRPELARWHVGHVGLPMLERPPGCKASGNPLWSMDVHDFPVLKVPFDPQRTSL